MASELEFYVFDDSYAQAREKHYRDLKTAGWYIEDYHVLETTKREPLMRAIRNGMVGAGIPVEFSKGEWGPGQEELNLTYAEALEMADRHVVYKNGVKEIAYLQGKAITFMAKWRPDLAGNSCHIHCSLWDGERNAFAAEHGESPLFRQFLAGLLAGRPRDEPVPRPLHQLLQALPGSLLRPHRDDLEPRQPHRRLQGAGPRPRHPHRVPRAGSGREPLRRLCRDAGGRAARGGEGAGMPAGLLRRRVPGSRAAVGAEDAA